MREHKRSNLFFLFAGILFFAGGVFAASPIARFVFTTDPQAVSPGELSGALKIQSQDVDNNETKTTETIDLEFSSTSATGEFLNASSSPVSTVMNKGTANRTFYYRDSALGSHALTVKAKGRDSGTSWSVSQTITVSDAVSGIPAPVPTPTPAPAPSPMPSPSSVQQPLPSSKINADAGADQTVTVGSMAHFSGSATGLKKEPLDTAARFWWNFGDGETQEGKFTTHIFRVPGTYIMGLHVSSGEYEASDYATVHVLANQMRVARVVEGADGYVQFLNPLNVETDIGDWIIEDATGKKFFIPSKTKIAAGAEVSFSNAITGLLQTDMHDLSVLYPLTVQYPNGTVAFTYTPAATSSRLVVTPTIGRAPIAPHAISTNPERALAAQAKPAPKENARATGTKSAYVLGGFSIYPRILFAGAVGLSVLGAVGFFVLKLFLL